MDDAGCMLHAGEVTLHSEAHVHAAGEVTLRSEAHVHAACQHVR